MHARTRARVAARKVRVATARVHATSIGARRLSTVSLQVEDVRHTSTALKRVGRLIAAAITHRCVAADSRTSGEKRQARQFVAAITVVVAATAAAAAICCSRMRSTAPK